VIGKIENAGSVIIPHHKYTVKGSDRGGQHQQQRPALGEEGDFAVHASVYDKVQAEPNVNDKRPREKKEEKDACWLP